MSPTVRLVCFLAFLSATSVFGTTRPISGLLSAANWTSASDKVAVSEEAGRVASLSAVKAGTTLDTLAN